MTTRKDLPGVTSIVRALGLEPACYDRLLDFFHSPALELNKLTPAWCALAFRFNSGILRIDLKPVLPQRCIKVAKAGHKMPGVKKLHQESDSNTKACDSKSKSLSSRPSGSLAPMPITSGWRP
jgi:hypothetical protein